MANYDFGEKRLEWSIKQGKDIEVWQTPKYKESRSKAVEILDSGKYAGVTPNDFWILKNETKNGKMAYTGLIISHNGCLKINDKLSSKFDPRSVSLDKDGYGGSLVFSYCNPDQGIFEVGEVSRGNCKNEYPYAMAFKRLFDRVVLKLSKLAYAGIYSDSEADEFKDPQVEREEGNTDPKNEKLDELVDTVNRAGLSSPRVICDACGGVVKPYTGRNGDTVDVETHIGITKDRYGAVLCRECAVKRQNEKAAAARSVRPDEAAV